MRDVQTCSSPQKKSFRKARRYLLHYILLGAFCLAIAFVMCYTVFFKVEKVKISGCTMYSETQIVDEIGVKKGDSLFRLNISNAEKKLVGKLPYIRSVNIKRQFPTTLKVEIQEEEVLGAVYTDSGFSLLSTTGKVLQTQLLALPEGIPRIVGLTSQTYDEGSYLKTSSDKDAQILPEIPVLAQVSEQLKANELEDITYYDVEDALNVKVMLEDRLLLKLGTDMDMDYKITFIKGVLDGKESGDEEFKNVPEEGTLDFSSPPALHALSLSVDKVKNEEAYLDFGIDPVSITEGHQSGLMPLASLPEEMEEDETDGIQAEDQQEKTQEQEVQQMNAQPQVNTAATTQANQINQINHSVVQNVAGGNTGTTQQPSQQTGGSTGTTQQPSQQTGEQNMNTAPLTDTQQMGGQNPNTASSMDTQQQTGGTVFNAPSQAPIVN